MPKESLLYKIGVCDYPPKTKNKNILILGDNFGVKSNEIYCFTVENGKVYAVCEKQKYFIKKRPFALEEMLGDDFIKINQSCIANISKWSWNWQQKATCFKN